MRAPKIRDRSGARIKFTSAFCHRVLGDLRRARSVEEVLPWLCLKGDIYRRYARGARNVVGTRSQRSVCGDDLSIQIPLGG